MEWKIFKEPYADRTFSRDIRQVHSLINEMLARWLGGVIKEKVNGVTLGEYKSWSRPAFCYRAKGKRPGQIVVWWYEDEDNMDRILIRVMGPWFYKVDNKVMSTPNELYNAVISIVDLGKIFRQINDF